MVADSAAPFGSVAPRYFERFEVAVVGNYPSRGQLLRDRSRMAPKTGGRIQISLFRLNRQIFETFAQHYGDVHRLALAEPFRPGSIEACRQGSTGIVQEFLILFEIVDIDGAENAPHPDLTLELQLAAEVGRQSDAALRVHLRFGAIVLRDERQRVGSGRIFLR